MYHRGKLTEGAEGKRGATITEQLLDWRGGGLQLRADAIASHDITYVGIIQTARLGGLKRFPLPYVLTCCHNSLCAVGGTINADDHAFGLSAAKKYGGEFVPPHVAVIHQYMRERYAAPGKVIIASDSHTRYGAYGTLGFGEGGPELCKQLLGLTYALAPPRVTAVRLTGAPQPNIGPHDVALSIIKELFPKGLVKDHILEFIGPGIASLNMDFRDGIDVMTTETACLSSVWETDSVTAAALERYGRGSEYKQLRPKDGAMYSAVCEVALDKIEPMIALPFHPSNTYTIKEFAASADELLRDISPDLRPVASQGLIAGCCGGLSGNIRAAAHILGGKTAGSGFNLSVYPASAPISATLLKEGTAASLMASGAIYKTAFCGPCFGAGDVPANNTLSLRHTTRNFPSREGAKPGEGQSAFVALMDSRHIAATAANGGIITACMEAVPTAEEKPSDFSAYTAKVAYFVGKGEPKAELRLGPGIADWPEIEPLPEDLELTCAAAIYDPVTTTDELIPSGEASSYRSNPLRLAQLTLSRREPEYVNRCKEIGRGSVVCALKPGDGSAREQAASSQRVLGGAANIAVEYATKRYLSNLINWGLLPLLWDRLGEGKVRPGDKFLLPNVRTKLLGGAQELDAVWLHGNIREKITLRLPPLSAEDREIIAAGCMMNHYAVQRPIRHSPSASD
ncbi:MAG: hydratase [Oscillospiraceae bacterium]|nr:hydratase [Oscillospiraceae bacterium]